MTTYTGWKAALTAALGKVADTTAAHQITLTAPLALTVPAGFPAGQVYRVVFTQDGVGGHTVTYGGAPVSVDLTAGASTLVEVWPGGRVVYPGAAGGGLDTEAVQDVVGAMVAGAGGTYNDAAGTITLPGGGSSTITADDTPAAPAEGESASYLVTSAVTWPAGLVWSTDPDGGVAPTITGAALVSLFTLGGVTRAILGATFPAPVVPDTTAPSTVTGLTATATGPTTVNLAWSAATDNVGVTGYEYRIDGGAAVDAGAGTAETVTGLTAGTLYSFEVRAYDAAGNRSAAWSTAATATTTAPDTTPPVWTATLNPGTPTQTSVVVTASALATDANAITYERTLDSTAGTPVWAAIVPSGLDFTLDGLTADTVYANCALRAKDAAGNLSTVFAVPSFTTSAAAASLSDAILALNPVGYWKLNETSGTQATDYSGNARHGTYSGTPALASTGGFVKGGTVTVPDSPAFELNNSGTGMTVFALLRTTWASGEHRFIRKYGSGFEWAVQSSEAIGARVWGSTFDDLMGENGPMNLEPHIWSAVAAAFPNPSAGARVPLYRDSGTALTTTQPGTYSGSYAGTASPLTLIGGDLDIALGHVAIFPTQLTGAQVQALVDAARADGLIP